MMRIRRYARRGIHINGVPTAVPTNALKACLPSVATVPLLQHDGPAATLVVKVGDELAEGAVIGKAAQGGVAVHSPIPGIVEGIIDYRLDDGRACQAVEVRLSGAFASLSGKSAPRNWLALDDKEILEAFESAGLIHDYYGNGSLAQAFERVRGNSNPALVINLLETMPAHAEHTLLAREYPAALVTAIRMAIRLLRVERVCIVTAPGHHRLARDFHAQVREQLSGLTELLLDPWYPNHLSEVIVKIYDRTLARATGAPAPLILVPRTLLAMHDAVVEGRTLVERHVVLAGEAFAKPVIVKARIGTPYYQIIEDAGGLQEMPAYLMANDSLQGFALRSVEASFTKECTAILAHTAAEVHPGPTSECINCGQCVQHCPVDLEPELLHGLIKQDRFVEARTIGLDRCIGCGLCSYICPSHIPLAQTFRQVQARRSAGEGAS